MKMKTILFSTKFSRIIEPVELLFNFVIPVWIY